MKCSKKEREVAIFSDGDFFAAFPVMVNLADGRLTAVFRQVPG